MIAASKKIGQKQIVITGALDFTIEKLMDYLGIEEYKANRLEFVNGYATGRILPPVMAIGDQSQMDARIQREKQHQFIRILRLFRFDFRFADAVNRRSSGRRQS